MTNGRRRAKGDNLLPQYELLGVGHRKDMPCPKRKCRGSLIEVAVRENLERTPGKLIIGPGSEKQRSVTAHFYCWSCRSSFNKDYVLKKVYKLLRGRGLGTPGNLSSNELSLLLGVHVVDGQVKAALKRFKKSGLGVAEP